MLDMIGQEINLGDTVMYPGGNARYGGLKLIVGVVVKMTPKRISLLISNFPFDEKAIKATTKTGKKVLKVDSTSILNSTAVANLKLESIEA